MQRLDRPEYIEDIKRIRNVLENYGYDLTLKESENLWLSYSDSMSAGWMGLPYSSSDIYDCVYSYLDDNKDEDD